MPLGWRIWSWFRNAGSCSLAAHSFILSCFWAHRPVASRSSHSWLGLTVDCYRWAHFGTLNALHHKSTWCLHQLLEFVVSNWVRRPTMWLACCFFGLFKVFVAQIRAGLPVRTDFFWVLFAERAFFFVASRRRGFASLVFWWAVILVDMGLNVSIIGWCSFANPVWFVSLCFRAVH